MSEAAWIVPHVIDFVKSQVRSLASLTQVILWFSVVLFNFSYYRAA